MNSILGKVIAENQRDWDLDVPYAVTAYRATAHEATGYSPNFLMFGREVAAPIDSVMGNPPNVSKSTPINEFVEDRLKISRDAYQNVREHLGKAAERQKHHYDLRVKPKLYQPGDLVWVFQRRRRTGRKLKWERGYTGPYTVVESVGPVNYIIRLSKTAKKVMVHVDKLKRMPEMTLKLDMAQRKIALLDLVSVMGKRCVSPRS